MALAESRYIFYLANALKGRWDTDFERVSVAVCHRPLANYY
jgi:hypothetical protein